MRQLFFCALALGAGLLMAAATPAQQNGYGSILSEIQTPTRYQPISLRQDDVAKPSEQAEPAPLQDLAPQTDANGDGYTYGNYLNARPVARLAGGQGQANWVVGVYGLVFHRDYEDDVPLSFVPTDPTSYASSTSIKTGTMGGLEAVIAKRGCNGRGFEARYWGLYPGVCCYQLNNFPDTAQGNFSQLDYGANTVFQVFNAADYHQFFRENAFHNLELNLLRNIGSSNCGNVNYEWLAGFRWFHFDESFRYATFSSTGGFPPELYYDTRAVNNLYGFQVGGNADRSLNGRWGVQFGSKVGIFGNRIGHQQSVSNDAGTFATINSGAFAGQDYAFDSRKNDFALLGELKAGLTYQFRPNTRIAGGYRLIGVSGVALAPNQIPVNFSDANDANRIDSNGSLILHGLYIGMEHAF